MKHQLQIPQELTEDLLVTMDGPTRLMMLLCESVQFASMPDQAHSILQTMVQTLPDSKIIEGPSSKGEAGPEDESVP